MGKQLPWAQKNKQEPYRVVDHVSPIYPTLAIFEGGTLLTVTEVDGESSALGGIFCAMKQKAQSPPAQEHMGMEQVETGQPHLQQTVHKFRVTV